MVHDTPEHNGIAERTHRTLLNAVQSLLHLEKFPSAQEHIGCTEVPTG